MVWSTPSTRNDVADIAGLPIDTPSGQKVLLGDVAQVRVRPIPNVIERQADSRRIDVAAGVSGRDLGSVADEVQDRLESVSYPRGYHAELLGEYHERQVAQRQLLGSATACRGGDPGAADAVVRELAAGVLRLRRPCRWRWSVGFWRPG